MMSEQKEEYVINPTTKRRIRVGSAVYKRLAKAGHFQPEAPRRCRSLKQKEPKAPPTTPAEPVGAGEGFHEYDAPEEFEADEPPTDNIAQTAPIADIVKVVIDTVILNRAAVADMSNSNKAIKKALFDAVMDQA